MKICRAIPLTLAVLACGVSATPVRAQKVYRCGSVYSQTPCEGAVALDVNDSRTAAQKREADQVIERDAKTANAMETRRLQQEKELAAQEAAARKKTEQRKQPTGRTAAEHKPAAHPSKNPKKGKKDVEFFTASGGKKETEKKPQNP